MKQATQKPQIQQPQIQRRPILTTGLLALATSLTACGTTSHQHTQSGYNTQTTQATQADGLKNGLSGLQVNFAQSNTANWNGVTIPTGQQCRHDKGINPTTPALTVSHIPTGATSLVFVYSDHSYTPMNNGGHGIFEYTLPKANNGTVEVPSIASNTFDIPNDFKVIAEHRGTSKGKAGAYMPPCSGGTNHHYFVTVQAVKGKSVISETVLKLGSY